MSLALQTGVVRTAINGFVDNLVAAIPDLLTGLTFLVLAAVLVKLVMIVVRFVLRRTVPAESAIYRQFVATLVFVFLCFGVVLSFLSIVGLEVIAASLGTATGFLALGVSYALSGMLADAVASVHLLRDPDFMQGDRVDGDTQVSGNAEIERKWTELDDQD